MRGRLAWWLPVLWLLAGCAAVPREPDPPPAVQDLFQERSAQVLAWTHWRIAGRITLELPDEQWNGVLNWRSMPAEQVLDVSGPAGRGGGRLYVRPFLSEWISRDGERRWARDPDDLLMLLTQRPIPVMGLAAWVRGAAHPGSSFEVVTEANGRPRRLQQDGWEILYLAYQEVPVPVPLPVMRAESAHARGNGVVGGVESGDGGTGIPAEGVGNTTAADTPVPGNARVDLALPVRLQLRRDDILLTVMVQRWLVEPPAEAAMSSSLSSPEGTRHGS